jgi:hypothetical protein
LVGGVEEQGTAVSGALVQSRSRVDAHGAVTYLGSQKRRFNGAVTYLGSQKRRFNGAVTYLGSQKRRFREQRFE